MVLFRHFNSSIQPVNSSTRRFNSSTHQPMALRHFLTRPGGLRAARLNPPPPEGSERVRMDFEIFFEFLFEFFELKESSQAPRIPRGGLVTPQVVQVNLSCSKKSIQKSIKILMSFWSRFWCLLGPFWPPKTTPFGDPDRPKIVPRRVLTPLLFEKVDFSKNERRCSHSTILTPKTAQDAAKIGSRSSQDGLKSDLKRDRFSR
mgnify:CR=1 FL=1